MGQDGCRRTRRFHRSLRECKTCLAHRAGPQQGVQVELLECGNPRELVSKAYRYFGRHFQAPIEIPQLAVELGTSVNCLDLSFDQIRGVTPARALQEHRLNKLFAALTDQPRQGLSRAIQACGLAQTAGVLMLFEQEFGIDMPLFLLTCRRAADDRLFRLHHPEPEALVLKI
jgi:methylphosphotriester-DNA--protein-cysteine methyltransferase